MSRITFNPEVEFARRVARRNGRIPSRLNERARVGRCSLDWCETPAMDNDYMNSTPLLCEAHRDEAHALANPPLFAWSRIAWGATACVVVVVVVMVLLALVAS